MQAKLAANAAGKAKRVKAAQPSLLVGLLEDGEGRAMTSSHATKPGRRYRYYVTRPDLVGEVSAWRVPAEDLEEVVTVHLAGVLGDKHLLCELAGDVSADTIRQMFAKADLMAATFRSGQAHERAQLLASLIVRLRLGQEQVELVVDKAKLGGLLGFDWQNVGFEPQLMLNLPATRVRKGRQLRLVLPGPVTAPKEPATTYDQKLVAILAEARHAQQLVLANPDKRFSSLSKTNGICRKRLGRLVAISCLAPDIVEAVLEGKQPAGLLAQCLMQVDLPIGWEQQRQVLGFGWGRNSECHAIRCWSARSASKHSMLWHPLGGD